jgi:hypothetical protein
MGGVFEAAMGIVIILWGDMIIAMATGMQLIPNYPLYWRTMGLLAFALGFLQIVASQNPSRFAIIPIVACFVRFVLPALSVLQVVATPSMGLILFFSTGADFILATVTFVMLYNEGYINKSILK